MKSKLMIGSPPIVAWGWPKGLLPGTRESSLHKHPFFPGLSIQFENLHTEPLVARGLWGSHSGVRVLSASALLAHGGALQEFENVGFRRQDDRGIRVQKRAISL